MKKPSLVLIVSSLVFAGVVCCACNKDADMSVNATVAKPTDAKDLANQGSGGAKARAGGGMMPAAHVAGPGEKTGIPK